MQSLNAPRQIIAYHEPQRINTAPAAQGLTLLRGRAAQCQVLLYEDANATAGLL